MRIIPCVVFLILLSGTGCGKTDSPAASGTEKGVSVDSVACPFSGKAPGDFRDRLTGDGLASVALKKMDGADPLRGPEKNNQEIYSFRISRKWSGEKALFSSGFAVAFYRFSETSEMQRLLSAYLKEYGIGEQGETLLVKSQPRYFIFHENCALALTYHCENAGLEEYWKQIKERLRNSFCHGDSRTLELGCGGPARWGTCPSPK